MGLVRSSMAIWKSFHSSRKPAPPPFDSMAATRSRPCASASSQVRDTAAASRTGNRAGCSCARAGNAAAIAAARMRFFMVSAFR